MSPAKKQDLSNKVFDNGRKIRWKIRQKGTLDRGKMVATNISMVRECQAGFRASLQLPSPPSGVVSSVASFSHMQPVPFAFSSPPTPEK